MIYESSYTTGQRPFLADLKRGYWSSASDFIYAGISLGFRMDVFAMTWIANVGLSVSSFIPTYLISMAFYVVPLMTVKSFMGQFSSSGFISSLRLCPLFKGIGFISLFLNVCVLIYYSIFATIPFVYLSASFNPTLPWSCEGAREWTKKNLPLCKSNGVYPCEAESSYDCYSTDVASSLYFNNLFESYTIFGTTYAFAWPLALSTLGVWAIVGFIVLKFSTQKIGLFIRYSVWFLIASLMVLIVCFSFLPGTAKHYGRMFSLDWKKFVNELFKIPIYGVCAFGPGWGLFISLASFNRFRTNINRSTWLIIIGQMFVIMGVDMLEKFIHLFFIESTNNTFMHHHTLFRTLFLSSGSVLATLAVPNLWCILCYSMFSIAAIVLMILQLHSILTSVFDEFASLRKNGRTIGLVLVCVMALISLRFSTKSGLDTSIDFFLDTIISQSLINLLLILAVTWIYGRVRFQRDMTFMTGTNFATWKVYILRFFAPLCMLAVMFATIIVSLFNAGFRGSGISSNFDLLLKTLPWWSIPAYAFYCLYRSQGSLKERLVKCCRPTDWYPVEAEERQRYEEIMNVSNMTHPLSEME